VCTFADDRSASQEDFFRHLIRHPGDQIWANFPHFFIPGLCLNYTSSRKFGHFFIDEVFYQNWQKICRLRYFLAVFKTSVTLSAIFLLEWIG
jgi:hypothetical protein